MGIEFIHSRPLASIRGPLLLPPRAPPFLHLVVILGPLLFAAVRESNVRLVSVTVRLVEGPIMNMRWTVAVLLGLAVGCSHHDKGEAKEGDEGNEVKMTLDQVPAPVRATLMRE